MTVSQEPPRRGQTSLDISVVICSHDVERQEKLEAAIDAVNKQSRPAHEIVFVADGAPELAETIKQQYPAVTVVPLEENQGLTTARNIGADVATGDVVAFLDDDAVPSRYWLAELTHLYTDRDALAAGGRLDAALDDRPLYLPREFDWLVGGTHRGFTDTDGDRDIQQVRNTFGSNLSFRRDVFQDLEGFDEDAGMEGSKLQQAAETMLCSELHDETDERVWYSPDAVVEHDFDEDRARFPFLVRRAFWQGYSKATMQRRTPDDGDEESAYLRMLLTDALPRRFVEAAAITVYTGAVGAGYVWNHVENALNL